MGQAHLHRLDLWDGTFERPAADDRGKGVVVQVTSRPMREDDKALSVLHRALPPKQWFYRWLCSKTLEGKGKDTMLRGFGR